MSFVLINMNSSHSWIQNSACDHHDLDKTYDTVCKRNERTALDSILRICNDQENEWLTSQEAGHQKSEIHWTMENHLEVEIMDYDKKMLVTPRIVRFDRKKRSMGIRCFACMVQVQPRQKCGCPRTALWSSPSCLSSGNEPDDISISYITISILL